MATTIVPIDDIDSQRIAAHGSGRAQLRHPARPANHSHAPAARCDPPLTTASSAIRRPCVDRGSGLDGPALFPDDGWLTRKPPSLHRLRAGRPVRRLQRCRVGGGALGCPHAGLRPPLKRSVRFSRTPLSQRHATSVGGSKESVRSSVQGPTHRRDHVPAAVASPDTAIS